MLTSPHLNKRPQTRLVLQECCTGAARFGKQRLSAKALNTLPSEYQVAMVLPRATGRFWNADGNRVRVQPMV